MDQRSRTIKALATLAICMTGGAFLLGWLEPTPQDYAAGHLALGHRTDAALLRGLAHQAVERAAGLPNGPWRSIELVAVPGPEAAITLTATTPPADVHFVVSRDGILQTVSSWTRPERNQATEPVIRIGLTGATDSSRLTTLQWAALKALLAELSDRMSGNGRDVPIRVASEQATDAAPAVDHLRDLLVREGLLS